MNNTAVINKDLILWGVGKEATETIPKIIWTFWDAPNPSSLVDICFMQIKALLPDYQFNIITKQNVSDFISDAPQPRNDISFINFTDWVRLKLLSTHGGIWMDASVLLTEDINWVYEILKNNTSNFFGFYADAFITDMNYPLVETWFFLSSKKNNFTVDWFKEFDKCYRSQHPWEYFAEEKKEKQFLHKLDQNLSNYLIAYLSAAKVMRKSNDYRMVLKKSSNSAHLYNFGLKLKPHELAFLFLKDQNTHEYPPLIKFERKGREAIDDSLAKGIFTKNSLLFNIIPKAYQVENTWKRKLNYYFYISKNIFKKLITRE